MTILKEIKKRKEPTKVLTERKEITRSFNKRLDTLLEKVCALLYFLNTCIHI